MSAVSDRDLRCVACDQPAGPFNEHHRRKGDRGDNRPSAKLLLCGSGTVLCHGKTEQVGATATNAGPRWARDRGYLVSRHLPRAATLDVLVWYNQPSLARVGWFQLDDDGGLNGPVGQPPPPGEAGSDG